MGLITWIKIDSILGKLDNIEKHLASLEVKIDKVNNYNNFTRNIESQIDALNNQISELKRTQR